MSESTASPIIAFTAIGTVFVSLFVLMAIEPPMAHAARSFVERHVQKAMFLIAGGAMAGSLYYSESVGFIPCEFCWFQRIAMYSLAIVLFVAVVSRGNLDGRFVVALAAVGLALSIYHYQLQLFPEQGKLCQTGVSCTTKDVNQWGFVTIPFMAGCGFVSILILQVARWRGAYLRRHLDEAEDAGTTVWAS
ncbi:hypothetical protein AYO38_10580 [bacterium SCGC AG-212-C10]|nr:hypothetical protein AYO38_10580 [bacterium SCGC AG-212-C10]